VDGETTKMNTTVFSIIQHQGLARGSIVQSLAGHDRLRPYIAIRVDDCYAYLADGGLRRFEKPKKKRVRHVRPLGMLNNLQTLDDVEALGDSGRRNSELRRLLSEFLTLNPPKEEI
jgi:hypothetical protein